MIAIARKGSGIKNLKVLFCLVLCLACGAVGASSAPAGESVAATVVRVQGSAVSARSHNELMSGEQALRTPGLRTRRQASSALRSLVEGQALHAGEAVLVSAHSSIVLRWRDGREERYGPADLPLEIQVVPLSPVSSVRGASARSRLEHAMDDVGSQLCPMLPGLLVAVAVLVALLLPRLPWFRYERATRVLGAVLFVLLVLPTSLLLVAAQLSRLVWLQMPMLGAGWSGVAAGYAHAANVAAFVLVFAGLLSLWAMSASLILGGGASLRRLGPLPWALAGLMLAVVSAGYLMPHFVRDGSAGWFHFWQGWARYYSRGVWLLLPFAQLLICRDTQPVGSSRGVRWPGVAASGTLFLFVFCYLVGAAQG